MKQTKKLPSQQQSAPLPDKSYESRAGTPKPEERIVIEARSEQFKGPLPHPEILRSYNEIVPGSAQSIIDSFVTEGDYRRKQGTRRMLMCEDWAREDIGLQKRGQVFGFILAFTGIAGGLAVMAFSARLGAEIGGAVVSGASLAAIVVAFLRRGRMNQAGNESE